jgi:biotin transport system substrate-specific component
MIQNFRIKVLSLERDASRLRQFTWIIIFSLLTAAGAWIQIPLTPVPITLQTFFVVLSGAMLGAKRGAVSQLAYLVYGLCGLPVFAGGMSSAAVLLGPTGGYLLSFPIAAFVAGILVSHKKNLFWNVAAFTLSSLPILFFGTLQLNLVAGGNWTDVFMIGFIPFLAGDFIKCAFASMVFSGMNRLRP